MRGNCLQISTFEPSADQMLAPKRLLLLRSPEASQRHIESSICVAMQPMIPTRRCRSARINALNTDQK